ncbi:MAG TPA: T9SS type A sorting domain-containing protein [Bacteroidales bacterium]|nr:T9SS type A sorting domain-containing protein [Bacteroidales bacterium]HPS50566.1 T9SS type A sorting domain-containing protein [Bacteroidales bacterium]
MTNLLTIRNGLAGLFLLLPCLMIGQNRPLPATDRARTHHEIPDQPYLAPGVKKSAPSHRNDEPGFFTTQVNVDANGNNIEGDAANEPSIAVDPNNPDRMVIGWRQFDNVGSNFRQAGYGYSTDGGLSWTFPGVIEPGIFRSDPVLDFDKEGNFYYNSLNSDNGVYTCKVFKSIDGGATWDAGTPAYGGDKQWMVIDRTNGPGSDNIYSFWTKYYSSCNPGAFTRSTNNGSSFEPCIEVDGEPYWGTMDFGPDGELYIAGGGIWDGFVVVKSSTAQIPGGSVGWDFSNQVDMDGYMTGQASVNPVGIMGQANICVDRSNGPGRGNVYVLGSLARLSNTDPGDVMFARSTDGGMTFSPPVRLNNDASMVNYQWFGTMAVAPNGRIDVIWLDTRDDLPGSLYSDLYYCYSDDQGTSWSINKRLSDTFNPLTGFPQQDKMGDYFDMVSDDIGAHLAWANTLNGEQDVYYTHIIPQIVGVEDPGAGRESAGLSIRPNPFRETALIQFSLPSKGNVRLEICNIYGSVVKTLVSGEKPAGIHTLSLRGENLSTGCYFCRLTYGEQSTVQKLVKVN